MGETCACGMTLLDGGPDTGHVCPAPASPPGEAPPHRCRDAGGCRACELERSALRAELQREKAAREDAERSRNRALNAESAQRARADALEAAPGHGPWIDYGPDAKSVNCWRCGTHRDYADSAPCIQLPGHERVEVVANQGRALAAEQRLREVEAEAQLAPIYKRCWDQSEDERFKTLAALTAAEQRLREVEGERDEAVKRAKKAEEDARYWHKQRDGLWGDYGEDD